jgi:hypothetical protein
MFSNMPESGDVMHPRWGPGFLPVNSWPYRVEYGVASVAILVVVFGWRLLILHAFPVGDILLFVLFLFLPDVVAFLPMAVSHAPQGGWPAWGSPVYNVMHSLLTWLGALLVAWVLSGSIFWPLLGWAAHITLDRAVGYHLRARAVSAPPFPEGRPH